MTMRTITVAVCAGLLAALAAPATSQAEAPTTTVTSVTTVPGRPEILQVRVESSSSPVAGVAATIRSAASDEVEATVDLNLGTEAGVWQSTAMTLPLGLHTADVTAVDDDGQSVTAPRFTFAYLLQPVVRQHEVDTRPLGPGHRSVAVQGILGLYDPRTQTLVPASGTTVRLWAGGKDPSEQTAVVSSYGWYSAVAFPEVPETEEAVEIPVTVTWDVDPATTLPLQDSTFGASALDDVSIPATRRHARVVLDTTDIAVRHPAAVSVSGTVEQLVDGLWVPLPNYLVTLSVGGSRLGSGYTGANGRFSITVIPQQDGQYTVALTAREADFDWVVDPGAVRGTLTIDVTDSSTLTWGQPTIDDHAYLSLYGGLTASSGVQLAGARVYVEQSADGRTGWRRIGSLLTNSTGRFATKRYLDHPSGYFRLVYLGSPTVQSGTSQVVRLSRVDTRIVGLNASPEPVRRWSSLMVQGTLQLWSGGRFVAGPGRYVAIYFRAKGTKGFRYAGTARTSASGAFAFRATARTDGTWTAAWEPGSSRYVNAYGTKDYVDVR